MTYTKLNPISRVALAAAIALDHPCTDRGCDIAVSLYHGFVQASAILLTGATETPHLDAVISLYNLDLGTVHDVPFDRWVAFHREYGRECLECGSYSYANPEDGWEPSVCSNCHAPLPDRTALAGN